LEAAAGKNPVSHVGKIYNFKGQEIADKINKLFHPEQVHVQLVSQIGKPVNQPFVGINYISENPIKESEVQQIIEESLSNQGLEEFREKILNNKLSVF